jgi:hypothetical protein
MLRVAQRNLYNKNYIGKLESWMFHTIILLISNLNKKEGYLLGLSVLYIFKKEIFFSSQKFG